MTELSEYTHIECDVTAAQFTADTQGELAAEIMKHAQAGLLDIYDLSTDNKTGSYVLTFRYIGDTSAQVVRLGDYVVILNTGNFFAVSEKDFNEHYLHTELDPTIDPSTVKTVEEVMVDIATAKYPDLGITSVADLSDTNLLKLATSMKDEIYDAGTDEIVFDFRNANLVNFNGIARVINAFMHVDFVTIKTSVVYRFENTTPAPDAINRGLNKFDIIGLTDLEAELKLVDTSTRLRKTLITFGTRSSDVPSSVLPSVTTKQFETFKNNLNGLVAQGFILRPEV